ncbi:MULTISPECIES: AarF/ABC1/UbiB kinase family protein [Alteromonadaceae]|jgi:predicted unusual protein kinase regulating ubiquinone biosynthesis (AarF/ABC1/UbiB family)|uniref:AarF/ABC1/UbiB kinase family protein n=1 Tax=Brumicola blandensis TaxID=3075611 RepID=A0AAW8R4W8_9ALTE|nr:MULTISPECIES: AarF/ABC1/UbiB kinase family protein [unclassified Alteromonas]MDT0583759.1 AarF/ABC1/UbiB kinase family protein [Alteromonas sp. W409]MDT0629116.1 AarF/ABC1/UbiB kinase family protein [Alteromonas sp. W364]
MRGAAMKLGQLLSMDAGELLPAEWEPILSRLRQNADAMPKTQLVATLENAWGKEWHKQFAYFSLEPIAAASIGQVHRAKLHDGRELAIKVQYPGVRESIDSDIDNVVGLIKLTGALPKHINIDPLLDEAKAQLKTEADYLQEAQFLKAYREDLAQNEHFIVPFVVDELTSSDILAMEYVEGSSISSLDEGISGEQHQVLANDICEKLMALTYIELFDTQLMQSDPNFANYLYQKDSGKIVLLDFGACRTLSDHTSEHYKAMAIAMQNQDRKGMELALLELGLIDKNMSSKVTDIILNACTIASECLQTKYANETYNIKAQGLIKRIQNETIPLIADRTATATPKFDVALVNRKITGMVLLANKLGAGLDFKSALAPYISPVVIKD